MAGGLDIGPVSTLSQWDADGQNHVSIASELHILAVGHDYSCYCFILFRAIL